MEYYRSNITGGVASQHLMDTNSAILNTASDSYAPNYWNISYADGLSPMKQIEGKNIITRFVENVYPVVNL